MSETKTQSQGEKRPNASKGGAAKSTSNGEKKPRECPVTKEQFFTKAPAVLPVSIGGQVAAAKRMEFSTGSFGWMLTGMVTLDIDGVAVDVQCSCNIVVVGSKPKA